MSNLLVSLNSIAGTAIEAVLNSLWLAVGVAALVWLALKFLGRITSTTINSATRYVIWWAVLGVVLVLPLAPRFAKLWHSGAPARAATPAPVSRGRAALLPSVAEPAVVMVEQRRVGTWPLWAFGFWAAILLFRFAQLGRSWLFLRGVKRRASMATRSLPDCGVSRPVRLLLSGDIESPMAVGFLRPAVVLPESVADQLEAPELDHVLLHEMAHIARLDDWTNLAARIAGAAMALHPVALWILRQIEREREMACDDFVVAQTGAARPYAESLARLFEMRWTRRGEVLSSGIFGNGSKLDDRIEMLLRRGREFSPKVSVKRVVSSGAVLLGFVLASALTPRWIAFAQERHTFEVAAVRPNQSWTEGSDFDLTPTGRLNVAHTTLRGLIRNAYGVQNDEIKGGPKWLDTDRYDIQAKAAGPIQEGEGRPLLQSLLRDRFALKVHRETAEMPVYELFVAKNGPKFKESTPGESSSDTHRAQGRVQITATRESVGQLAGILGRQLGRVVADKTGLTGSYDFALEWDPEQGVDSSRPSVFAALQEQLGLRLESGKGPVDLLVIDHAEKPDAN